MHAAARSRRSHQGRTLLVATRLPYSEKRSDLDRQLRVDGLRDRRSWPSRARRSRLRLLHHVRHSDSFGIRRWTVCSMRIRNRVHRRRRRRKIGRVFRLRAPRLPRDESLRGGARLRKAAITFALRIGRFAAGYWARDSMIHCPKCGLVPVPEKDLPVTLRITEIYG